MMIAEKKVCLVTGAARGIGAATARAAARAGYAVCINYVSAATEAGSLVAEIERSGGTAVACQADIGHEDEVSALFREIDHTLGRIGALVNNAGVAGGRREVGDVDSALLRRIVDVNFLGAFRCIQEAVSRMAISRGGSGGAIVNISSIATKTGGYRLSPYVASKAAVEGLTTALAAELASDGIRINAVRPGIIATDQNPVQNADEIARKAASIPAGRLGTPEEVANAILWLLSDDASYITGAMVPVAGGK